MVEYSSTKLVFASLGQLWDGMEWNDHDHDLNCWPMMFRKSILRELPLHSSFIPVHRTRLQLRTCFTKMAMMIISGLKHSQDNNNILRMIRERHPYGMYKKNILVRFLSSSRVCMSMWISSTSLLYTMIWACVRVSISWSYISSLASVV